MWDNRELPGVQGSQKHLVNWPLSSRPKADVDGISVDTGK